VQSTDKIPAALYRTEEEVEEPLPAKHNHSGPAQSLNRCTRQSNDIRTQERSYFSLNRKSLPNSQGHRSESLAKDGFLAHRTILLGKLGEVPDQAQGTDACAGVLGIPNRPKNTQGIDQIRGNENT
jgi:hypothetical protein